MRVCYFGIYNPAYNRNRVLISGLKANNIEVIECNSREKGFKKYLDLIKKYFQIKKDYDFMIVAFPGYQAVVLAKLLTRKKIIFDAFTSLYDSMVDDRKLVKRASLKALYYWVLDYLSCRLADKILLDTVENIKYFVKKFKIRKEKFIRVFVGADNSLKNIKLENGKNSKFLVHFHGSYIPLQGMEVIIGAIRKLEDVSEISFNIIGSKIKEKYENCACKNVNFIDNMKYEELFKYIYKADLCLGIFGNTEKAQRVIANKIYEAILCKKPVLTMDSLAIKELFEDGKNIILCNNNSEDLARKIRFLFLNNKLRLKIKNNVQTIYNEKLTPYIIVKDLIKSLNLK